MLLNESAYRLSVALLLLTALVASVPLMASAEEEEATYGFLSITTSEDGGSVTVSGEVEGDNLTTLDVELTGNLSGTTDVQSDGTFSITTSVVYGPSTAVLKDSSGNTLDTTPVDLYP